jgi:hypothetical protein
MDNANNLSKLFCILFPSYVHNLFHGHSPHSLWINFSSNKQKYFNPMIKVRKSHKQIVVSPILPKNNRNFCMILGRDANSPTGNDPRGIGGSGNGKLPYPGERGIFSLFLGFRVGESGNKNTKYRHSFESLVHNHHYTLEILGFHFMKY